MTRTTWKTRALVAVVALQVAIPLVALVGGQLPTRFGFQMYSGRGGAIVEVRDSHGRLLPFEWATTVASLPRPDLDWSGPLPGYVCAHTPDAATVTVKQNGHERVVPCD